MKNNITVINREGTEINYQAAEMLMDAELREALCWDRWFDSEQEFFTAYEDAHEREFGEAWELSKANPCW